MVKLWAQTVEVVSWHVGGLNSGLFPLIFVPIATFFIGEIFYSVLLEMAWRLSGVWHCKFMLEPWKAHIPKSSILSSGGCELKSMLIFIFRAVGIFLVFLTLLMFFHCVHSEYFIFPLEYLFNMQLRNTCMSVRQVIIRRSKTNKQTKKYSAICLSCVKAFFLYWIWIIIYDQYFGQEVSTALCFDSAIQITLSLWIWSVLIVWAIVQIGRFLS